MRNPVTIRYCDIESAESGDFTTPKVDGTSMPTEHAKSTTINYDNYDDKFTPGAKIELCV